MQQIENSKVMSLTGMINYQQDAVVSKTLIKKDTGIVTLFAFDQGQGLSEHTAPFDALVYVPEGDAEIRISAKSHHLKAGETIVMLAGEPHSLKALTRFKMMLVMFKSTE